VPYSGSSAEASVEATGAIEIPWWLIAAGVAGVGLIALIGVIAYTEFKRRKP
jgi:hypothetical protein